MNDGMKPGAPSLLAEFFNSRIDLEKIFQTAVPRIANMALRALAMGSKFVLMIVLARILEPAQIGLYGLFTATLYFSVIFIGVDYYTYSQRELLSVPKDRWSFVLQHQVIAIGLLYLLILPLQLPLFYFNLLPSKFLYWFYILLLFEHISQELNRILVAMQRPLMASIVLFIRMGAWVWLIIPMMWFNHDTRNLNAIFLAWFVGTATASFVGGIMVWRGSRPWRWWPIDRAWILRGYKTGLMFFLATLSFMTLRTIDRYIVNFLVGPSLLGVYTLFMGLAMTVISLMEPAVFSFLYPPIVSAYQKGDRITYRTLMREMGIWTIALSIALAAIVGIFTPFVLHWIDRPLYTEHLSLIWLLLSVTVIYAGGMIPHYGLYAMRADRSIMFAHLSSLVVFFVVVALLASTTPLYTVPYALLAAFTWMGIYKLWRYSCLRSD